MLSASFFTGMTTERSIRVIPAIYHKSDTGDIPRWCRADKNRGLRLRDDDFEYRQRSTQAILKTLVAPGVPNGMPAVMTTRWPGWAIPSRWAMRTAFCTISPKLLTSLVCTQCAPHKTAKRRAVPRFEVNTRIGASGRSRAARKAVAPDVV